MFSLFMKRKKAAADSQEFEIRMPISFSTARWAEREITQNMIEKMADLMVEKFKKRVVEDIDDKELAKLVKQNMIDKIVGGKDA